MLGPNTALELSKVYGGGVKFRGKCRNFDAPQKFDPQFIYSIKNINT